MAYPKYSKVDNKVYFNDLSEKISCPDSVKNYSVRHPKVYIPIVDGQGVCPYCGTLFVHKTTQEKS